MVNIKSIFTWCISVTLMVLVVAVTIVQYHHHDECDRVCLCMNPLHHCHDAEHHDCNHQDDQDCQLHFEDSIIIDHTGDYLLALVMPVADIDFLYDALSVMQSQPFSFPPVIDCKSCAGFIDSHSLRAPPVL